MHCMNPEDAPNPTHDPETRWSKDKAAAMAACLVRSDFLEEVEETQIPPLDIQSHRNASRFRRDCIVRDGAHDPALAFDLAKASTAEYMQETEYRQEDLTKRRRRANDLVGISDVLLADASDLYDSNPDRFRQMDADEFWQKTAELSYCRSRADSCEFSLLEIVGAGAEFEAKVVQSSQILHSDRYRASKGFDTDATKSFWRARRASFIGEGAHTVRTALKRALGDDSEQATAELDDDVRAITEQYEGRALFKHGDEAELILEFQRLVVTKWTEHLGRIQEDVKAREARLLGRSVEPVE